MADNTRYLDAFAECVHHIADCTTCGGDSDDCATGAALTSNFKAEEEAFRAERLTERTAEAKARQSWLRSLR